MRSLALGWQLALRSWRSSIVRTSSMAIGMILAGFVAAAFFSLPAIFDGRNARTESVAISSPIDDNIDGATEAIGLIGRSIEEQIPQGRLDRVLLAQSDPTVPATLPPGVTVFPSPGQVVMSPALSDLVDHEPLVAARFPQERVGTVGDDGLVGPNDLVAYVGVSPDDRLSPLAFGATDAWLPIKAGEVNIAMIVAAAFLALPAGMFLATSSRLSARARDQRLASLRLLGMSRKAVRTVSAVETAIVAAIGAVIGCGLWALAQPALGRFGVGGFRWFAADAPLRPFTVLAAAVLAALAAVAVGTVTANDAIDEPLATRRQGTPAVRIAWRASVLALGLALLIAARARNDDQIDNVFFTLLIVGGFAAAIGITLATPVVSQLLGSLLGQRPSGATRMLVARRLRHEPSAAGRVLTGVLVATFALGVGHGVVGAFQDVSGHREDATVGLDTRLTSDELALVTGVISAVPSVTIDRAALGLPTDADTQAFAASCAQLEAQLDQSLLDCTDGQPFELTYVSQPSVLGLPVVVAQWPSDSSQSISGIIVPPGAGETNQFWSVRIDTALRQEFEAALVAADPIAFPGNYPDDRELGDMVSALVTAGSIAAFVIGLGAVVVATSDRAIERRSLDASLLAIGIPGTILRRAQLWTVSLPVAVTVTLAAFIGTLAGHLYRQAGLSLPRPYPWNVALLSSTIGIAVAMVAGALAYALARPELRPADLRTE